MSAELDGLVRRLLGMQSRQPAVLSVYLTLPVDSSEGLRGIGARLHGLLADVGARAEQVGDRRLRQQLLADLDAVRDTVTAHARQWLGRGVAVFAAGDLDLFAAQRLPCAVPDLAVLGPRPHVRPLISASRRCLPYCAAVLDRRHSWLYLAQDGDIRLAKQLAGESQRASSYAGWHGLEEQRVREHAGQLVRQHYQATVAELDEIFRGGEYDRLIIGGHTDGVAEFRAALPTDLRDRLAGTFVIDPHTMTAAQVGEHAGRVVADWESVRQQRLVADTLAESPAGLVATGVPACLAAAGEQAIDVLAVADDLTVRGSCCMTCDALGVTEGPCAVCGGATRAVPDVVDELVARVSAHGGLVESVATPHGAVARLRHAVRQGQY